MKIKFLIPVLTFLAVLAAQAWATAEVAKMTTTVLSASPSRTVMRIEIPAETIDHNLSTVQFGGHVYDGFGEFIAIAGHGNPTARVLSVNTGAVVNTFGIPENDIAQSPDELVMVGAPIIVHDLRLVTVNAMPLLRGGDGLVRTVSSFEVEIITSGVGENEKPEPTSLSYAFAPVYRHLVRNLDEAFPELSVSAPGRFLIIARTRMIESELAGVTVWNNYLDLKRRKGYQVQIASYRTIYQAVGDTSQNGVRQFISQTYHDPNLPSLDYALIIGDGEESGAYVVPAWFRANPEDANQNSTGDNDYFTVDGSDYIADVLHGRVPAQITPEVVNYLSKVIRYETNPYRADPHWFHSATFVAGNYVDGTSPTYPVTPVWNMRWAREWMLRDGCITDADTFYFHDPSEVAGDLTEDITNDINAGVSAVLYRGWADDEAWQRPVWGNAQLENLHLEDGRNPAFFSIVCGAGRYALGTSQRCLGEMLTVGIGSTTNPNGAVVFYGASDFHTNTRHNNSILSGVTEALLIDGIRTTGGLTFSGELEATRQFPRELDADGVNSYVRYYIWHAMNILGDPEVPLVICEPTELTVYAPTQLAVGETVVSVGVAAPGQPTVENAVVTIRSEGQQNFSTERTNQGGVAWVPVQFTEAGTAQITVWKGRHFLKTVTIPVVSLAYDPQISTHGFGAGDDYLPNPGETITLSFGVRNRGTSATPYTITATSPDPRLTITMGTATVDNVPPGEERLSTSLGLILPQDTYDGQEIVLNLNFSNGTDQTNRVFMLPVYAADPLITQLTINDGNNGILEPNEAADITVTVRNAGGVRAPTLAAEVSSWDNAISFSDASITWPALEIGQESASTTTFHAQIANGVTRGRQIQLRFVFTDEGQIMARKTALLTVGVLDATVPTGPDEYGYYAYENVDAGFAKTPTLNWIELDPARGGSGADPHQVRDDTHFAMELPVPFTYYGQSYDSIWICSNGWLSFEEATMPEFRNWEIPSPIGPPSMVCPFWDDLIGAGISDSSINVRYNVWTRHEPAQNRFIVQWRNWNRRGHSENPGTPNADSCSFEIVLEYNASGDGDILFQYAAIANTDGTNNFASVGIQDSWHQRGIGLTYSGYRPVTVDTLVAGRAIRFSTTPPDNFLGSEETPTVTPKQFALHEAYPNPFNPATELRFDLAQSGHVSLRVFDLLGREAATLVDEIRPAGTYTVRFDAGGLTTGLYFARLTSGSHTAVRKIMLIK